MDTHLHTNGTQTPHGAAPSPEAFALRQREDEAFANALRAVEHTTLDEIFSMQWLTSFHRKIFEGIHEHAGTLRTTPIRVAWHIPQAQTQPQVEEAVEQYLADARKRLALALLRSEAVLALIGFAFWKLTYIAPFADGNGRVANGISMLLQRRFDLPGIAVYDRSQKEEYAQFVHALRAYDTGNAAPYFEHLRKKFGVEHQ